MKCSWIMQDIAHTTPVGFCNEIYWHDQVTFVVTKACKVSQQC